MVAFKIAKGTISRQNAVKAWASFMTLFLRLAQSACVLLKLYPAHCRLVAEALRLLASRPVHGTYSFDFVQALGFLGVGLGPPEAVSWGADGGTLPRCVFATKRIFALRQRQENLALL